MSILLDNALKYSPPGGEITVTLARQGKSLLLTVANTAQTLSKELLENMFDRFYRGDKARSSEQGGLWHRPVHRQGGGTEPQRGKSPPLPGETNW